MSRASLGRASRLRFASRAMAAPAGKQAIRLSTRALTQAPELAVLGLLEAALEMSARSLHSEHPTVDELSDPRGEPVTLRRARQVLCAIHPLERAVRRYRITLLAQLAETGWDDDESPF